MGLIPGEGKGNPLQYSGLKNPVDRGAWWTTVQKVTKSQTRLSTHTRTHIRDNTTSDQIRSVAQLCPTLCDTMNRSTPGLPVHHQLPEFTQTHVHRVSDAIQPSHPRSSPSPPAPNPSQHQSCPMSQLFA